MSSLRPRRAAAPSRPSFLVPVVRRRDGHGLAFLRHHDQRDRRAQARAGAAAGELGLHVCGGRGNHSRKTPQELMTIGDRVGLDGQALARASRLVAKVDSAAVQDGYDLYLHGFIVADDGKWVVVQQGMNGDNRQARRYHWLSEGLASFVEAPHSAIEGKGHGEIVNLTVRPAELRAAASSICWIARAGRHRAASCATLEPREPPPAVAASSSCRISSCRAPRRPPQGRHRAACMATSPPRPTAARRTSPSCCWCRASARARCGAGDGLRSRPWRALSLRRAGQRVVL